MSSIYKNLSPAAKFLPILRLFFISQKRVPVRPELVEGRVSGGMIGRNVSGAPKAGAMTQPIISAADDRRAYTRLGERPDKPALP
ncbi:MAG: hypothetical protein ABJG15_06395 [Hyphomonadaceae bacterium]